MNNTRFTIEKPVNEKIYGYSPGSPERERIDKELQRQASTVVDIPLIIGGKEVRTGDTGEVVMPCEHSHVLATYHKAGEEQVRMAMESAMKARKE